MEVEAKSQFFEQERAKLRSQAIEVGSFGHVDLLKLLLMLLIDPQSLGRLTTSLSNLNRSIEDSVAVGAQFASVNALWSKYASSMRGEEVTSSAPTSNDKVDPAFGA